MKQFDLSNASEITKMLNSFEPREYHLFDNVQTRYLRKNTSKPQISKSDVDEAIENLKEFDVIGFDKNINQFLTSILNHFGLVYTPTTNRVDNALNHKFGLEASDESICEALKPLVVHDLALYQYLETNHFYAN
ncbi:hypothetical protein [Thalassotalea sp. PS06]|uniref:hypothetical protein n=1 Tax=Thalassotalea sp. PS06 TaxID=2594005 RepID=UPI001162383C|nr:hypothetical protein [Thalassotalea sp. PS06]QDP01941.1 hypothetical protein FNC98_11675 [Thalassotalea sp. PS06]